MFDTFSVFQAFLEQTTLMDDCKGFLFFLQRLLRQMFSYQVTSWEGTHWGGVCILRVSVLSHFDTLTCTLGFGDEPATSI